MKKNIPLGLSIFAILSSLTGLGLAGTHTWSGAGGNALWSNAANWSSGGVPAAGEAAPVKLIFPSNAVNRTSTLNIANLKIDAIEINTAGGGYTFTNGGTPTTLTGAAGDNIVVSGSAYDVIWQPGLQLQATSRINLASGATLDFQGIVSGNGGLTKTGAGTLEFTTGAAANTFTGPLRVEAGLVNLNKIAGTPCFGGNLEIVAGTVRVVRSHQIPDSSVITMTAGALTITKEPGGGNTYEAVGSIHISGNATIGVLSPNSMGLGGNITCDNSSAARLSISATQDARLDFVGATRTFAVPHANSSIEITGIINGNGSNAGLTKTGEGKLKLTGDSTLNGPFAINGGTFEIGTAGGLGTTSGSTTIAAGATLTLPNVVLPPAESIYLAGTINTRLGAGAEIQGNVILSGSPSLGSNGGNTLKLSGVVSGSPAELGILASIVEFSGSSPNTYSGLTRVMSGDFATLALNKTAGPAVTGDIQINNKGLLKSMRSHQIPDSAAISFDTGGSFDLNHQTETVNSISSSSTTISPRIDLGNGSLTVIGNGSCQLGYNGAGAATITGTSAASFRKQGSGTMILVGATGDLTTQDLTLHVQSGVFDIRGYWRSPIQVLGGLLKGTAQIASVIAAGGDIAFDQVTSTNFTYTGAGGKLIFALNGQLPGTGFPRATITGGLNLTGIQLEGSLDFIPRNDSSFTLIENNGPGPVSGTFAGLPEGSLITIGGQPFRISYQGGPEGKDVVLTFVGKGYGIPEITAVIQKPFGMVQIDMKGIPGEKVTLFYNTNGLSGTWNSAGLQVMDASGNATTTRYTSYAKSEFYRLSYTK